MNPESDSPNRAAETIFNAALQFSTAERPAYLTGACGNNAPLRQRVEVLLRAHEQAQSFFPEQPASREGATYLAVPITEQPGDKVGRYKLRQRIGEGGMGVVYMAEQEEPVRRQVALKISKLGMDTPQVVAALKPSGR